MLRKENVGLLTVNVKAKAGNTLLFMALFVVTWSVIALAVPLPRSLCLSCFSESLCFLLVLCLPRLESRWISELMFHLPWLNVCSTFLFKQISTLSSPCQANHDYLICRGFNTVTVISDIVSLLPLCLFLAWAWHCFYSCYLFMSMSVIPPSPGALYLLCTPFTSRLFSLPT